MTTYGVTDAGFVLKTFEVIKDEIEQFQADNISPTWDADDETHTGQLNNIIANQAASCWEAMEDIYNGRDVDNASDAQLDQNGRAVGIERAGAQRSQCWIDFGFDDAVEVDLVRGETLVANEDKPEQTWTPLENTTVNNGINAGRVLFECTLDGAEDADTGTLTTLVAVPDNVVSASNPISAYVGRLADSPVEYRAKLIRADNTSGVGMVAAIQRNVSRVIGVRSVLVDVNMRSAWAGALPPRSVAVTIDDQSPEAAADDDVAQAIFDAVLGLTTVGTESGVASDGLNGTQPVAFERITQVDLYIVVEAYIDDDYEGDDAVAAAVANITPGIGEDVFPFTFEKLLCGIAGIRNADVKIGTSFAGAQNQRFQIANSERGVVASSRIMVNSQRWSNL